MHSYLPTYIHACIHNIHTDIHSYQYKVYTYTHTYAQTRVLSVYKGLVGKIQECIFRLPSGGCKNLQLVVHVEGLPAHGALQPNVLGAFLTHTVFGRSFQFGSSIPYTVLS